MSQNEENNKHILKKCCNFGIVSFSIALIVGTVLGAMIFLRPTVSENEKRKLTEFPEFTMESFLDGTYFSNISLWYSDTYPMRDSLIGFNQELKAMYGIEGETMLVGGNKTGDDIPDEIPQIDDTAIDKEDNEKDKEIAKDENKENVEKDDKVELPDSKEMETAIQNQIQQGLYVKNGAAYSVYYFSQLAADTYINALNKAAKVLEGTTKVYSILVPNNSGAMLSQDELDKLGGSDQGKAIKYYYNQYKNVTGIKTLETLREHNDEYLYFRTDHHWTQLGAYYVYRNFCEQKGITPNELSSFKTMTFNNFLGTFYSTLQNKDMASNPDTVTAYVPNDTNDMTFWDVDNSQVNWHVITDVSSWNQGSGYYCYIGGDKPLSIIKNPKKKDGSSCLLVKESYGNCFAPFLVDHYETVYIIDFRYAKVNVVDYVKQNNIKDLIIMNNISIIGSEDVANSIGKLLAN